MRDDDSVKAEMATMAAMVSDARVVFDLDLFSGAFQRTREQLGAITLDTRSPCRNVTVHTGADGGLAGIEIAPSATARLDHRELARVLTQTIQRGEQIAAGALEVIARRAGKGRP